MKRFYTIFLTILIAFLVVLMCVTTLFPKAEDECDHKLWYTTECSVSGIRQIVCAGCHMILSTETNVTFDTEVHSYDDYDYYTPPTCSKEGYTTRRCRLCDRHYVIETYPPTGEHYSSDTEWNCIKICDNCGQEFGSHEWAPATCEDPPYCVNCGLMSGDKLGHIIINNNCTKNRYCARCYCSLELSGHYNMINGKCNDCGYIDLFGRLKYFIIIIGRFICGL